MRSSHLLPLTQCHRATTVPSGMKANENFSEAILERFYSVSINRVKSPSDGVDLELTL